MNAQTKQAPEAAKPEAKAPDAKPAEGTSKPADSKAPEGDAKPTEAAPAEPKPDPFANLPRCKVGEVPDVLDMTGVPTNNPYKYEAVHAEAVAAKLPVRANWKHREAVFVPGHNKGGENGFKPGSVYGTIADVAARAGRSGIEAQELVTLVRQRQIGNKRSKYCEQLPPVGWVEGWVDTAVTKGIVGIHPTKKARVLVVAPAGTEATPEQNAAAKAKAKAA